MKLPRFPWRPKRNAIAWIFIILVALFLTEQDSLFDGPVPLPAELGLERELELGQTP